MTKLYDSQITEIMPDVLAESSESKALSYALNKALKRLIDFCANISVYAAIDLAEDEVLDLLAVELNTQYYDTSLPIENKRQLIKNTFIWYQNSGTASTVEELIAAVFGEGSVSEWFEYGDDPYYFKITTNAQLTPDIVNQFTAILKRAKNVRSHIRHIDIHRTVDQHEYVGTGAVTKPRIPVTNSPIKERHISEGEYIAAGVRASPREHISNHKNLSQGTDSNVSIALMTKSEPRAKITNNSVTEASISGSMQTAAAVISAPHIRIGSS